MKKSILQILDSATAGDCVLITGWVKSKRVSKSAAFLVINDGSMQRDLQVVVDSASPAAGSLDRCQTGAAVEIAGTIQSSPGTGQTWEVLADSVEVLGEADALSYPLQKKGHSLEFLREIGHLRGRTNTFGAVFRVRNALSMLIHEFFQKRGFIWAHTPIITANDCEGAGEQFLVTTLDPARARDPKSGTGYEMDFFGVRTHLTVSGQLEAEALALGLRSVYTFGPTFRAENSNTSRHLAEFWMVEPEMAFVDLEGLSSIAEEFLKFLFLGVVERCSEEMKFFSSFYKNSSAEDLLALAEIKYHRMTYSEVVATLEKSDAKFEHPVSWGLDLQSEHERYMTEVVCRGPLIVSDYPKEIKPFYMRLNSDGKTVAAMDVLVPRLGELIGGSQREERLSCLLERIESLKMPAESLNWYLDLRRFGSAPHAGFGLGFERLVQFVTGMGNIRDVIPFPRTPGSISF